MNPGLTTATSENRLLPFSSSATAAAMIPGADYLEITSNFGHDGFLLETAQLTEIISKLLP